MAKQSERGQGLSVLLVEDHDTVAEMMLMMLDQLGHGAKRAASVAQAREMIEQGDFDIMLCDYSLPDGNAFDLAKQLEGRERPRGILLTAYGSDSLPRSTGGFVRYMEKPVDIDELQQTITEVHEAPQPDRS